MNHSDEGRSLAEVQQVHAQNYAFMSHNLMVLIQEYLLLSDDNKQRGALKSLELVDSTAQLREDNRICIWLEDVWPLCCLQCAAKVSEF